jgi:hypothetical protein
MQDERKAEDVDMTLTSDNCTDESTAATLPQTEVGPRDTDYARLRRSLDAAPPLRPMPSKIPDSVDRTECVKLTLPQKRSLLVTLHLPPPKRLNLSQQAVEVDTSAVMGESSIERREGGAENAGFQDHQAGAEGVKRSSSIGSTSSLSSVDWTLLNEVDNPSKV